MTEQLQGRALDEVVALAMGWEYYSSPNLSFGGWFAPGVARTPAKSGWYRAYSTDCSTQAEMLEWLRGKDAEWVEITDWFDGIEDGQCRVSAICWLGGDDDFAGRGDTINEALARLVLAVAGRDAK